MKKAQKKQSEKGMQISITPRKITDRGGAVCMPLLRNVPKGRPEWELTTCPKCGAKCWKDPAVDFVVEYQGATAMCTFCALREGVKIK